MVSACVFATLLEYPGSPLRHFFPNPLVRRLLMGLAMALTAVGIIYSPWGMRSGAHINPAVTFSFWYLGKIEPRDAVFYVVSQFLGATVGVAVAAWLLGAALADPSVGYVVTMPGMWGVAGAFATETIMAFLLMLVILTVSNDARLASYTGLFAAGLVACYITAAAPLSGMSINPARSFSAAFIANHWTHLWIYCSAPPLGMVLAAELYQHYKGRQAVKCCKLHHNNRQRCIFRCNYRQPVQTPILAVVQP
jgi:aquaporin Z